MPTSVTTVVPLTAELCADWFANAYSDEQALFFALIEERLATEISNHRRDMQMIAIAKEAGANTRRFVFRLANWIKAHDLGGQQWEDAINHYPES